MQIKAIASSADRLVDGRHQSRFAGLAGITNEDQTSTCTFVTSDRCHPASVSEIIRGGTLFAHGFGMQYQVQNMSTGNIPSDTGPSQPRSVRCPGDTIDEQPIAHLRK